MSCDVYRHAFATMPEETGWWDTARREMTEWCERLSVALLFKYNEGAHDLEMAQEKLSSFVRHDGCNMRVR